VGGKDGVIHNVSLIVRITVLEGKGLGSKSVPAVSMRRGSTLSGGLKDTGYHILIKEPVSEEPFFRG